jgi:hypothetical protein
MSKIWITYSWDDNMSGDVDFIAQELAQLADIKLDRWNISPGRRLWEQIDHFISSPEQSDAWVLIATNNSLSSKACKEEYALALDRAINQRGNDYPVIALFLSACDYDLIPGGIRTRLYVSITEPYWKEKIIAAAEGRPPEVQRPYVPPYYYCIHKDQPGTYSIVIEVRPRAGVWAPFVAAIPLCEKDKVKPKIMIGPKDLPTMNGALFNTSDYIWTNEDDSAFWCKTASNQATPTESYYIWCQTLPSRLFFGAMHGQNLYKIDFIT